MGLIKVMGIEGLEIYDLKLEKERRYNLQDSGLTKLVFDEDSVDLVQSGFHHKIVALNLLLADYVWNSQTTEEGYERLICPVYMLQGRFADFSGSIYGVIRPHTLRSSVYPEILPNLPPEFNFYLDTNEADEVGRSINFENGKLICRLMDWTHLKQNEINPHFSVNLAPNSRTIYFEKPKK